MAKLEEETGLKLAEGKSVVHFRSKEDADLHAHRFPKSFKVKPSLDVNYLNVPISENPAWVNEQLD